MFCELENRFSRSYCSLIVISFCVCIVTLNNGHVYLPISGFDYAPQQEVIDFGNSCSVFFPVCLRFVYMQSVCVEIISYCCQFLTVPSRY